MAEVYDGVIYGDYSKYTRLRINYTVSQNETTAVSTITMNLYAERTKGSEQYNNSGQAYWNLTGKGNTSMKFSWAASSLEMHLGSSSTTVQHNPDGTGSVTLSGYWYTGRTGSSYIPEAISVSKNITLKTIPRASTITCSTANIGSNPTISIKRASDSFTHTITYTYGSGDLKKTGTIATKTGLTTITSWTIPDNFYQNIPNDREGSGSLTCTTYSGNTAIGTSTCNFTVKAVESAARPKVTATLKDTNSTTIALTGDANKLIKGKSTAQLVVTSTLQKYAGSIKSVTVNGGNIGTAASITKTYANVSTASYSIITTDSRNYPSETVTKTASMVNYVPLTLSATIFRPQPTGTEIQMSYSGNYFNGSFGSVANTLSITWKYRVQGASSWTNGGTITPTLSGNTISSKTISLGTKYNYQTAYDFQITAVDKLTTNTQTIAVSVGMPVFYWGKDFFNIIGKIKSRLNLHTNAGLYWKEGAYGDQFEIIPDFGDDNDNNKLKIRGAVGAINTSPSLYDLFYITGMSGNAWFKGYINSPAVRSKLESTNARISNANIGHTYENGRAHVQLLLATSTMTSNKPIKDGYILHFSWDNDGQYNAQFFIGNGTGIDSGKVQVRGCTDGTWSSWETLDRMKVLYDNSSGTTGTVTLSETAANFNYLEIFYRNSYSFHTSTRIANPNGKCAELEVTHVHGSSSKAVTIESRNVDINGTSLTTGTRDSYGKWWSAGNNLEIVNNIYIYKVVGYR